MGKTEGAEMARERKGKEYLSMGGYSGQRLRPVVMLAMIAEARKCFGLISASSKTRTF